MSFLSKLFKSPIVKSLGMAGASVVFPELVPVLAPVFQMAIDGAVTAEKNFGGGQGVSKFKFALDLAAVLTPRILGEIERKTGRKLADRLLFDDGIRDLVNGVVKVLNSFGLLAEKAEAE